MAKKSGVFKVFLSGVVGLVWRLSPYNKFVCKRSKAFFCGYSFLPFRGVLINFFANSGSSNFKLRNKINQRFFFVSVFTSPFTVF